MTQKPGLQESHLNERRRFGLASHAPPRYCHVLRVDSTLDQSVALRRLADGSFAVEGNVDVHIGLKVKALELSSDSGRNLLKRPGANADGLVNDVVKAETMLAPQGARLRVQ